MLILTMIKLSTINRNGLIEKCQGYFLIIIIIIFIEGAQLAKAVFSGAP